MSSGKARSHQEKEGMVKRNTWLPQKQSNRGSNRGLMLWSRVHFDVQVRTREVVANPYCPAESDKGESSG